MAVQLILIPIYTTKGDCAAFLAYPYLYNRQGEWIGWINTEREVYSVHGAYVGWLSNDPRILRKRSDSYGRPRRAHPAPSNLDITPPAHVPLAPLMPELSMNTVDVLEEEPDLLPCLDFGEQRQDMD